MINKLTWRSGLGEFSLEFFQPWVSLCYRGRKFDWHPLDVVVPAINDNTTCVGSVVPSPAGAQFDLHAGDSFLRNVYNVYVGSHLIQYCILMSFL